MADYDSNMVKPVEGLQNITGLTAVKRREQRRRRQQLPEENKGKNESAEGQDKPLEERAEDENGRNPESVTIDYCA